MQSNKYVDNFLASTESPKTQSSYRDTLEAFDAFCKTQGKDFSSVVTEWREARLSDSRRAEIIFVDEWQDVVRAFHTHIKPKYASLSTKQFLSIVKSFFKYNKIPVDIDLPKHTFVTFHNRDLNKNDIRLIVSRSSVRNRALWLMLAESGMRVGTAINMKYEWIKQDFEKQRLPMRINTPSQFMKDHVGERWTFIGEDGFKALQEYLKPRLPLKDDDYVFALEKPSKTQQAQHSQFTIQNVSVTFGQTVRKLKLDQTTTKGKPAHIRLHGLRKYFRNNCRADWSYREFWMGHSIGTDEHYISRNPEDHYPLYAKAYEELRVLEPSKETQKQLSGLEDKLTEKDREINLLKGELQEIKTTYAQLLPLAKFLQDTTEKDNLNSVLNAYGNRIETVKENGKPKRTLQIELTEKQLKLIGQEDFGKNITELSESLQKALNTTLNEIIVKRQGFKPKREKQTENKKPK